MSTSHTARPWSAGIEALIAPISAGNPVGESLRYSETYERIKEARRADDPTLPQGIWQTQLKRADWEAVGAIGAEALATRSKDLQIAAWVLEAWCQLHGMAGVRAGLELLIRLCEQYWETIHPQLEGDRVEQRLSPFRWINEKLYLQLKNIPFTRPQADDAPAYTWLDWENALYWEHAAKHNGHAVQPNEAHVTIARFRESSIATPTTFYTALDADLDGAIAATQALERYLRQQCGERAPALSQFLGSLRDMHGKVTTLLASREGGDPAEPAGAPVPIAVRSVAGAWPIQSREDAYRRLDVIADYLMRIEPHSPTPFLVKRAVAWGSMSLTDLVLELVQNRGDQESIFTLLGIKQGGS
jgi:type VI secretion system protein ImpA